MQINSWNYFFCRIAHNLLMELVCKRIIYIFIFLGGNFTFERSKQNNVNTDFALYVII